MADWPRGAIQGAHGHPNSGTDVNGQRIPQPGGQRQLPNMKLHCSPFTTTKSCTANGAGVLHADEKVKAERTEPQGSCCPRRHDKEVFQRSHSNGGPKESLKVLDFQRKTQGGDI